MSQMLHISVLVILGSLYKRSSKLGPDHANDRCNDYVGRVSRSTESELTARITPDARRYGEINALSRSSAPRLMAGRRLALVSNVSLVEAWNSFSSFQQITTECDCGHLGVSYSSVEVSTHP